MNHGNRKIFKGIVSFPVIFMVSFIIFKKLFVMDAPDNIDEETARLGAPVFSFVISLPISILGSISISISNPSISDFNKEKAISFLKYSAVSILAFIFFAYFPFWALIGLYSAISLLNLFVIFFCLISVYILFSYLFPDNPVIRRLLSLSVVGFIGFDFFDGDFDFDTEASDLSGAEGQISQSSEVETGISGATAEDTGVTESNQEAPIDLDGDGEIDGFDINGDGSIDVNVVGVEVPNTEHVEGYVRENGTLVSPYVRTTADSIAVNNLEPTA